MQLSGGTSSRDELWKTGLPEDLRLAIYRVAEAALSNILKHASATKAELRLDLASEEMVKVTIVDNGCGFDAKTTTPGFGILSMQDHCGAVGGSLQIESIAGEGTAMIASFPLPKRRMAADAPSLPHFIDETVPILSSNGNGNGNGKGAVDHVHPADWIKEGVTTLLVVDDQPDFCELIKDLLKPYEEFQILACSHDGLTALKMVEELQPDVVLLDIEMPALHELDTGNIIHSRFPTVKVVLMSAHHQRESMTDAIPSAAVDFIGKAEFSVNRLLQACRKERAPEAVTSATTSSPGLD